MLQLVKYVALISQDPNLEALWRWLARNINNFRGTAHKVFNRLINCKVRARGVELPISKPNRFSKVCDSIKYRPRYRVVL